MSAATVAGIHPVTGLVARTADNVAAMRDAWLVSMDAAAAGAALVELNRLQSELTELQARVAVRAQQAGTAETTGATSLANWLAVTTRQSRTSTHRFMRLAESLDRDVFEPVRVALSEGRVNPDQALVITDAVDALPDEVEPETRDRAVDVLLAEAGHHDPVALRRLGKRLLDVVAPEVGEAHEAKVVEAEEERARAHTRLTMTDDGHGITHGRFQLPTAQAQMLKKALHAIAAPKAQTARHGTLPVRRPGPERMGQALCELIERIPANVLPAAGGVNATAAVLMSLETFCGGHGVAHLDTGATISAGQARRLACEAGIIPAVLGGPSQVLDLGRTRRFHTKSQRIAIAIRDGSCTAEDCDWPPGMCHAHHDPAWTQGGVTDIDHARLLCPQHHARAHDPAYTTTCRPDGKITFHRRT
ncbi:HNH endonuclease signature motif containing protein [Nocardioides dongkuii]|uniref:HNH endonuclease signature motif containing protein n=1 Tax=Nocardioides dongkuii TaxID=2760089 RepID=UPI0015FB0416|nr:HNH endonuclease signature motif containing protein [Nocardioides dongkuii]